MNARSPDGWRSHIALADLRWIWAALIALVIFGGFVLLWPNYRKALGAVCRDEYARDKTAGDTLATDGLRPLVRSPKFANQSVSCGVLRQTGKL